MKRCVKKKEQKKKNNCGVAAGGADRPLLRDYYFKALSFSAARVVYTFRSLGLRAPPSPSLILLAQQVFLPKTLLALG